MPALETFRKLPMRHNCAQAIAYQWRTLYNDPDIVASYAPYVGGRAPKGYCGALFAACQACPSFAQNIESEFTAVCGSAFCSQIKSERHTPCEVCVETADKLVAKYSQRQK